MNQFSTSETFIVNFQLPVLYNPFKSHKAWILDQDGGMRQKMAILPYKGWEWRGGGQRLWDSTYMYMIDFNQAF